MNDYGSEKSLSLLRLTKVLAIPLLIAAAAFWYTQTATQRAYDQQQQNFMGTFGLLKPTKNRLSSDYQDTDGDLIADSPKDESDWIDPETLVFSFIPGQAAVEREAATWKDLMDKIQEATGKTVEFRNFENSTTQLTALRAGELHVTACNSGAVPKAVNTSGFVPLCCIGKEGGKFGYNMLVVTSPGSKIRQLADIKGRKLTFTSTESNSGFKAPVVLLMYDYDMKPVRDYDFGFTNSHDRSLGDLKNGIIEVACVASDMIDRAVTRGEYQPDDFQIVYSSERFPPAAFGVDFRLKPDLREKIKQAFLDLAMAGSSMSSGMGLPADAKLVPVSFKDDWAIIRRINDAIGETRNTPRSSADPFPESGDETAAGAATADEAPTDENKSG